MFLLQYGTLFADRIFQPSTIGLTRTTGPLAPNAFGSLKRIFPFKALPAAENERRYTPRIIRAISILQVIDEGIDFVFEIKNIFPWHRRCSPEGMAGRDKSYKGIRYYMPFLLPQHFLIPDPSFLKEALHRFIKPDLQGLLMIIFFQVKASLVCNPRRPSNSPKLLTRTTPDKAGI